MVCWGNTILRTAFFVFGGRTFSAPFTRLTCLFTEMVLLASSTFAQSRASSSPRCRPEVNSRKNIGRYPAQSAS